MKLASIALFILSACIITFLFTTNQFNVTQSYDYKGSISPSYVTVDHIYEVNSKINDVLYQLVNQEFFKIFRVNIVSPCMLWPSTFKCKLNQCPIDEEDKLKNVTHIKVYKVDKNLTAEDVEFTSHIKVENYSNTVFHDEWIFDEHKGNSSMYVNLVKNPERFSGYNGSAIWYEFYKGNLAQMKFPKNGAHENFLNKIFSGLQSSINMHISHSYLKELEIDDMFIDFDESSFYKNYTIFYERIGKYEPRVKNLFYLYTFLIHTFDELGFYLPKYTYDTVDNQNNIFIQNKMKNLDQIFDLIPNTRTIESDLFLSISKPDLRDILKPQFTNMTHLLDCIGCNICKLNAKVQITGLATMLKVLLPEKEPILITENEMVGLVNLFYRVSNSIKWYQENRQSEERYRLSVLFHTFK